MPTLPTPKPLPLWTALCTGSTSSCRAQSCLLSSCPPVFPQLSDKPPPNKPNPASGNSIERTEDNFAGLLTGFFPSIKLICFLRPPSTSSLGSKTRELIPCPRPPRGILLNSWPCHKLRSLKMTHGLSGWSSKTKRQNGASKEQQEG